MLNEEIKKYSIEGAEATKDMVDPKILVSPVFTLNEDEWKRVIYSFVSLASSLQDKLNIPFVIRVIDADDEMVVADLDTFNEFSTDIDTGIGE
jgi:hypothetical protein